MLGTYLSGVGTRLIIFDKANLHTFTINCRYLDKSSDSNVKRKKQRTWMTDTPIMPAKWRIMRRSDVTLEEIYPQKGAIIIFYGHLCTFQASILIDVPLIFLQMFSVYSYRIFSGRYSNDILGIFQTVLLHSVNVIRTLLC